MNETPKKKGGPRPGSGRKPKKIEHDLVTLLGRGWPKEKRLQTIEKLSEQAAAGDKEAAKILLAYAYGKPTERKEISGPGGGAVPISIIEFVRPEGA